MTILSQPIVIAAIAAAAIALIILIIAASMLIYRRLHPRIPSNPYGESAPSTSTRSRRHHPRTVGDDGSMAQTPITAQTPNQKSPNPYLTPTVPWVQQPPPPSHRRIPQSISHHTHPRHLSTSTFGVPALTSPDAHIHSASITPRSRSKTRQKDSPPATSASQPLSIYPSPPAHRMSADSSVMLITYEQGLAKLGLTSSSRPPLPSATASTPSPALIASSPSHVGRDTPNLVTPTTSRSVGVASSPYSYPLTPAPLSSQSRRKEIGQLGSGKAWKESERESSAIGREGAWLPSYYQPAGEKQDVAKSNGRWGGKV